MSTPKRAFVLGASGAVGSRLVEILVASKQFSRVVLMGRRNIDTLPQSDILEQKVVDFESIEQNSEDFKDLDVGFCALGTTRAKAGAEGFYKVDHDYVVNAAQAAKGQGVKEFVLVSSTGANENACLLYPKTKGETERDVAKFGFDKLLIARPGFVENRGGGILYFSADIVNKSSDDYHDWNLTFTWSSLGKSDSPCVSETISLGSLLSGQTQSHKLMISNENISLPLVCAVDFVRLFDISGQLTTFRVNLDHHVVSLLNRLSIKHDAPNKKAEGASAGKGFYKVDHDYVVNTAKVAKEQGVKEFMLVTSMGSNEDAFFLYPKTKGETERDVAALGFDKFLIARPGFLENRGGDFRLGECVANILLAPVKLFSNSVAISTENVAKALVVGSLSTDLSGKVIWENAELLKKASEFEANTSKSSSE